MSLRTSRGRAERFGALVPAAPRPTPACVPADAHAASRRANSSGRVLLRNLGTLWRPRRRRPPLLRDRTRVSACRRPSTYSAASRSRAPSTTACRLEAASFRSTSSGMPSTSSPPRHLVEPLVTSSNLGGTRRLDRCARARGRRRTANRSWRPAATARSHCKFLRSPRSPPVRPMPMIETIISQGLIFSDSP